MNPFELGIWQVLEWNRSSNDGYFDELNFRSWPGAHIDGGAPTAVIRFFTGAANVGYPVPCTDWRFRPGADIRKIQLLGR